MGERGGGERGDGVKHGVKHGMKMSIKAVRKIIDGWTLRVGNETGLTIDDILRPTLRPTRVDKEGGTKERGKKRSREGGGGEGGGILRTLWVRRVLWGNV
jgi:hypothetical protein